MREMVNDDPSSKRARVTLTGQVNDKPFTVERSTSKGGASKSGKSELLLTVDGDDRRGYECTARMYCVFLMWMPCCYL